MGKNIRKKFYIILIVFILLGCGAEKVKAPFKDGLYLKYEGNGLEMSYKFHLLKDANFEIEYIVNTEYSSGKEKFVIDPYGEYLDPKDKIPIWLPPKYREEGIPWRRMGFYIEKKSHWEKWDVWIAKYKGVDDINYYYDVTTGFCVGKESFTIIGGIKLIIVDTNADIPTVE